MSKPDMYPEPQQDEQGNTYYFVPDGGDDFDVEYA